MRTKKVKEKIKVVSIYILLCPVTGKVRYVGKTQQTLKKRLGQHLNFYSADNNLTSKNKWIVALSSEGLIPLIKKIKTVALRNAKNDELIYIKKYLKKYPDLLNVTGKK